MLIHSEPEKIPVKPGNAFSLLSIYYHVISNWLSFDLLSPTLDT